MTIAPLGVDYCALTEYAYMSSEERLLIQVKLFMLTVT